jgi:hypothetical protein
LDEMIARAKAACLRSRQAADHPGLTPLTARVRLGSCHAMEKTLARLRAQRMAVPDS